MTLPGKHAAPAHSRCRLTPTDEALKDERLDRPVWWKGVPHCDHELVSTHIRHQRESPLSSPRRKSLTSTAPTTVALTSVTGSTAIPQSSKSFATARSSIASAAAAGSDDEILGRLMQWLLPRWDNFWSKFSYDGTMSKATFFNMVHFNGVFDAATTERAWLLLDVEGAGKLRSSVALRTRRAHERHFVIGTHGREGLQKLLVRQFGNVVRGWRLAIDPANEHTISIHKFCRACKSIGFNGDLRMLWHECTRGEHQKLVTFADVCPEAEYLLCRLGQALTDRYGSFYGGWRILLRCGGFTNKVGVDAFMRFLSRLGFSTSESKDLFAYLDTDRNKYVTQADLSFFSQFERTDVEETDLDITDFQPGAAFPAELLRFWPGDASHEEVSLVMTVEEYKDYVQQRCDHETEELDGGSHDLHPALQERMRNVFKQAVSHLPSEKAMRQYLMETVDEDGSGHIDFEELLGSVRELLSVTASEISDKQLKMLFDKLDADGGGSIDVSELLDFIMGAQAVAARGYRQTHSPRLSALAAWSTAAKANDKEDEKVWLRPHTVKSHTSELKQTDAGKAAGHVPICDGKSLLHLAKSAGRQTTEALNIVASTAW